MGRTSMRWAAPLRAAGTNLLARVLSLIAGVAANILLLRWAIVDLSTVEFGVLVVIINVGLVIQQLDLGVTSLLTNRSAGRAGDHCVVGARLADWVTATCLSSSGVLLCILAAGCIAASVWTGAIWLTPSSLSQFGLVAVGAVVANISRIWLADLLGRGHVRRYFLCQLWQSAGLIAGGLTVNLCNAGGLGYAAVVAGSAVLPGLTAALSQAGKLHGQRGAIGSPRAATALALIAKGLPLGVRQGSALLAFGTAPLVGGLLLGPEVAAAYGVPHRIFLSAWSIVGVVHAMGWRPMAQAVESGSPDAIQAIITRLTGVGAALAVIAAAAIGMMGPSVATALGQRDQDIVSSLYWLAGAALVVRSLSLGCSLYVGVRVPSLRFSVAEGSVAFGILLLGVCAAIFQSSTGAPMTTMVGCAMSTLLFALWAVLRWPRAGSAE